jgi:N-acyl-D-aspartate/D-glutamate deacylase
MADEYDVVIRGGRVVDPESGLDAVRDIGIEGGRIAAVSATPLEGRITIDATGLVVAPGFIDLHYHGQDAANYRYAALDGVTTALELEIGTADVAAWYAARAGGQLINYGVSAGHPPVRMAVMRDPGTFLPSGDAAHRAATPEEIAEIERRLDEGLRQGALAMGFGVAYTAAASRWEILEAFRVAAAHHASTHVHIRGGIDGLQEVIADAAVTGAALQVVHLNSSALKQTPEMLQIIGEAEDRGLDVTTEAYPYAAGQTRIETALFGDWESWPDPEFQLYEWPTTGERLTRESFGAYREQGGSVILHTNTPDMVDTAIESPLTMIASDGWLEDGKGHPRTTGTYARVLGRYVREQHALSLMDALAKMTIRPARRLEARVPAMREKGRIRPGADGDVVVFDPAAIVDRSSYREPTLPPDGIAHVLVHGTAVVSDGKLVAGVAPGLPVRAPLGS